MFELGLRMARVQREEKEGMMGILAGGKELSPEKMGSVSGCEQFQQVLRLLGNSEGQL